MKLWIVCIFIYFFVIFEMHHMAFRYNIYPKENMDLTLRLVSDITLEDVEPMRRTKKRGS